MEQGQDIYFQGKIYQGCEQGESRYNYPCVEVAGSHGWEDGQSVVLLVDYKLAKNCIDPECTEPELTDIYSACCETVAIPLTVAHRDNTEARDKAAELWQLFGKYFEPKFSEEGKIMQKEKQRHCVLDCVDEEIVLLKILLTYPELKNNFFIVDEINDLQQVRNEIENI